MPNPNDTLAEQAVQDTMDLIRLANGQAQAVTQRLSLLENDLKRLILGGNLTDVNRTLYRNGRANKVVAEASREINKAYRDVQRSLTSYLQGLAKAVRDQEVASLSDALGVDAAGATAKELSRLADRLLVQGSRVGDWVKKMASDARHRFATSLRQAVVLRQSEDQIVKSVIGAPRFRLRDARGREFWEFAGGVGDTARNQLTTFVQTATNELASDVRDRVRQAQEGGRVIGVQDVAVLDNRTTPGCRAKHGAAWDLDGNPLPNSPVKMPYPGPPPYHWRCRTIHVPVLAGHPLPVDFTFEDWFARQPVAEQRDMLGPNRYDLWKKGLVGFQDMVDQKGRTLTLDQLRRRVATRRRKKK
jgi:hypothetical protein